MKLKENAFVFITKSGNLKITFLEEKNEKEILLMAVSMMGLLMLSACQTNKTADSATTETTAKTEVTVKDTNGQLTVPKNPKKVVVLIMVPWIQWMH